MKRFTILMLVLVLSLTVVSSAFAAGAQPPQPPAKGSGVFALVGKITEIDPVAKTVTVNVVRGNVLVKPFIGKTLVIQTTATTRFFYTDGVTTKVITFADLKVGDPVSANGKLANGVWTANRITEGAKLSCLP
jgi:hypothetical protein